MTTRLKLKNTERMFSIEDLFRLFCKSIFKESLIETILVIEESAESNIGLPLKISNFQRRQMMKGVMKPTNNLNLGEAEQE